MNMTKLSVSSIVLAAALSGCSQQQVIGGSQVINGSGGSQASGHSQVSGSSQQQVESSMPVIAATPVVTPRPVVKRAPVRVYNKPQVKRVVSKPKMTHSVRRGTGLPPAKPGQCFAKVKTAPKYITKSKRVFIQAASSKRVLVRAPQYRWISKKVLVRKAQYINRTIPAQYRNQTKKVLVRPAYNTWKKGHGAITRIDNMTGQIMCRVTVPAQYKNVTKRVQVRAVQKVRKFIPAVYKTVKQKQRVSGAIYKTVNRPARYATKNYRVKVAGARYIWRPLLCATNAPKNYKHKSNHRKAAIMQKPVKRAHKQHYKRSAAGSAGISYAQYLAVMNAPLKSKASHKKATKKKAAKKMMPKQEAPKAMPKQAVPKASSEIKMAPKSDVQSVKALVADKTAASAPKKKDNKAEIQQNIVYGIQAALKSKGFNPGKLDGKMGPNTAKALKAFQNSRGLPVGVLSKDTFRALGLVR
ncbi:MAG: hypothetical protein ACI88H_003309 [Cocleimonas sp.]|jgi:hypothetical protein